MAATIHLSIPGIPGESTEINFAGTLNASSYSWGLEHPPTGNLGAGSPKTAFQALGVTKIVDRASPLLMQALTQGRKIPSMTLLISAASGRGPAAPFLVYQFQTVRISVIQESGGGDLPSENVQFSFGAYRLSYRTTAPPNILGTPVTSAWSILTDSVPGGPAPR